jgi:hypothetical protein
MSRLIWSSSANGLSNVGRDGQTRRTSMAFLLGWSGFNCPKGLRKALNLAKK